MIILFGALILGRFCVPVLAALSHNLKGILIYYLSGLDIFGIIDAK